MFAVHCIRHVHCIHQLMSGVRLDHVNRIRILRLGWLLPLMYLAAACTTLKPAPPQPVVSALVPAKAGVISEVADRAAAGFTDKDSGYLLLSRNQDALNWRLALADHATTSIDVQYFIWQDDASGNLLFDRLLRAADRGVRVRLLVDDIWLAPNDAAIAAASSHPNLEIKIFNPGYARHAVAGWLEFLAKFQELNRRMHNKLFVVDGRMAIVGGRNIGDPYFGLSERYNFRDLDVLAIGPVVAEISSAFDEYWNAELAYPGELLSDRYSSADLDRLRKELGAEIRDRSGQLASYPLQPRDWSVELAAAVQDLHKGEGHFLQDDPVVMQGEELKLFDMLRILAAPSHQELLVVSPYYIPVEGRLDDLARLENEGVRVKVLTASLAANNHTLAHSHYKKYRRRILDTGAELYEFRHDPAPEIRERVDVPPVESAFVSLHTKMLVGDRQRCFIGSLNLDPRALQINTENGLYIESPSLAAEMAYKFDVMTHPDNAWRVEMDEGRALQWTSTAGTVYRQPARSFMQRIADFFYRLLPIESQL